LFFEKLQYIRTRTLSFCHSESYVKLSLSEPVKKLKHRFQKRFDFHQFLVLFDRQIA